MSNVTFRKTTTTTTTTIEIGLTWGHFSDGDNEVLFIVQ